MKVNQGNSGPIRPERPRDPRPTPAHPVALPVRVTPARQERVDRVDISAAGRARASRLEPVGADAAERLAAVRQRILEGAYDADAVVADLARRILDRGDI
jgi:hypothetical protein